MDPSAEARKGIMQAYREFLALRVVATITLDVGAFFRRDRLRNTG